MKIEDIKKELECIEAQRVALMQMSEASRQVFVETMARARKANETMDFESYEKELSKLKQLEKQQKLTNKMLDATLERSRALLITVYGPVLGPKIYDMICSGVEDTFSRDP